MHNVTIHSVAYCFLKTLGSIIPVKYATEQNSIIKILIILNYTTDEMKF